MANVDLLDIIRVCHSHSGVKTISLTNTDNISMSTGLPVVINSNLVYTIVFRRGSGGFTEKSRDSKAGQFIEQNLDMYVNAKRFDMDYILGQLLNNRCHVIYTDFNGLGEVMLNSKISFQYNSGKKLGTDSNGYKVEFNCQTVKKYMDLSGIGITIPTGADPVPGEETGVTSEGEVGGNTTPPFYVVINPTQLLTTPPLSGNTTNLNTYVTGADGNNYFIDHLGNAMQLPVFPKYDLKFTSGDFSGNTLTVPGATPLPTSNDLYHIYLNGDLVTYSATATTDTQYFNRSGQQLTFFRLTANTKIRIIW